MRERTPAPRSAVQTMTDCASLRSNRPLFDPRRRRRVESHGRPSPRPLQDATARRAGQKRREAAGAQPRAACFLSKRAWVCLAWALDWRCKSFAGRVGSNREPEATARGDAVERRQTRRREAVWGRSRRRAAAPNVSEALCRPGRSGERAKERDAQNPTEVGAVVGTGAAVHPVSLPWEVCMGPRNRWAGRSRPWRH